MAKKKLTKKEIEDIKQSKEYIRQLKETIKNT